MSVTPGSSILLVVDQMPFRRAQLVSFLEGWASEKRLRIIVSDITAISALEQLPDCSLAILSIGSEHLMEPRLTAAFRVLKAVYPRTPIVIIGESANNGNVAFALEYEASGYIPANLEAHIAVAALSFILAGGTYFPTGALLAIGAPPEVTPPPPPKRLPISTTYGEDRAKTGLSEKGNGESPGHQISPPEEMLGGHTGDLTARQVQVLVCLRSGQSNKQIARELEMSEATVKVHVRQVMKRLGATNRTQAAVLAMQLPKIETGIPRRTGPVVAYAAAGRPSLATSRG
jgi:DNA-binding NarL/FixJ family response regulator